MPTDVNSMPNETTQNASREIFMEKRSSAALMVSWENTIIYREYRNFDEDLRQVH